MKEYLTDAELELLIEQMERQELYAPRHMKEQIMNRAFPKQTVEVLPKSGGRERPASLLAYRIKIIAGMAAAIVMLMILPVQERMHRYDEGAERRLRTERTLEESGKKAGEVSKRRGVDFNRAFNEGTWKIDRKINSWFDKINNWNFDNLFENGGNYYED